MIFYLLLCTTLCLNSSVQKTDSMDPITKLPLELFAHIANFNTPPKVINNPKNLNYDDEKPNAQYLEERRKHITDLVNFALVSKSFRLGAYTFAFHQLLIPNEKKLLNTSLNLYHKLHKTLGAANNIPLAILTNDTLSENIKKFNPYDSAHTFVLPTNATNTLSQLSLPTELVIYRHAKDTINDNIVCCTLLAPWCAISPARYVKSNLIGTNNNACEAISNRNNNHLNFSHLTITDLPKVHLGIIANRGTAINHLIFRAMENSYNEERRKKILHIDDVVDNLLPVKDVRDIAVDYIDFLED